MLIKDTKRLIVFVAPFSILIFLVFRALSDRPLEISSKVSGWLENAFPANTKQEDGGQTPPADQFEPSSSIAITTSDDDSASGEAASSHHEVFSVSTINRKHFLINFGDQKAINPNIIPHPTLSETWIIVAQKHKSAVKNSIWHVELVCNAVLNNDGLSCLEPPTILPIAGTSSDKCEGDLGFFSLNIGPHDARIFYGPKSPYTIYGSQSTFSCFGQWIQDLRMLYDWGFEMFKEEEFRKGTELQRPQPYGAVEKNWFVFWDKNGQVYAHHDVAPKRVFAKLNYDGSVGPNLAPFAATNDEKCLQRYLPILPPELESIHQATNSLLVTLCRRSDPSCEQTDSNTFIFHIFQHKKFYGFHSTYEPYAMLFRQTEPFEVYAISEKPIWIHGRSKKAPDGAEANWSEMFYVTSMSWKKQGQKYHGYLDDVLFVAFGIEDNGTGAIDTLADDLLKNLGLCEAV